MKNFITSVELKESFNQHIILDCRYDLSDSNFGHMSYLKSHIKNSHYFDLEKDLSREVEKHGGRHPLPFLADFISKLENIGISNDSKIVVYDDDMFVAPRLWWMLKYIGIEDVKVLDGGFKSWNYEELIESKHNTKKPSLGKIYAQINQSMVVNIEEVKKMIDESNEYSMIVDSRTNERYLGIMEPIDKIPGRIPTSINIFYNDAYSNGYLKSKKELEKLYSKIIPYKEIVVYCGSGVTAPANIIAMDEIGILTRLYVGSYSDYISYEENEVEVG
ncbi:thiosulfate/3-mercaptopyruvate sulfurtransferase [Acetoanaerobium pronyense]|uniref:Thiosulfate/3-mercaptopyruvate sulfurtransferase n=1 Tax=Acetoanaerobium pronyense TaxID=1482736 RepID=A0ABS4KNJ8_9FIRM|nr:sulfurtransferase [Acetoanaerobium pronyense]MBP2028204.1 thiosulfate/3-mercaptopyruvate sulfurtransferase [Acetoanaerobium pronyense]